MPGTNDQRIGADSGIDIGIDMGTGRGIFSGSPVATLTHY
jgi:hypothetical protein